MNRALMVMLLVLLVSPVSSGQTTAPTQARVESNVIYGMYSWWADEMWLLESVWSPVGSRAYVTFLVDPQFDGSRKKGEAVCAVMASLLKPACSLRGEQEFTFSFGQGGRITCPISSRSLGTLRGANKESD